MSKLRIVNFFCLLGPKGFGIVKKNSLAPACAFFQQPVWDMKRIICAAVDVKIPYLIGYYLLNDTAFIDPFASYFSH